jgi:hypothetical protein
MAFATLLQIDGIDIGDFAARDLTMELTPVEQSVQINRTINGVAIDLSLPQFRKYAAVISCADQESPVFAGIWPGTQVTVTCIPHLGTNALDTGGEQEQLVLTMMVQAWQVTTREWQHQTDWSLPLVEV